MKFNIGDYVEVIADKYRKGEKGLVVNKSHVYHAYCIKFEKDDYEDWYPEHDLKLIKHNEKTSKTNKSFKEIATEIGEFTDMKNEAYGSSVDATYEMIKVLLQRYRNEDSTYTIPESLIKHMLLQVRMMDKQNRIFSNPDGDKMNESPYKDLAGYSLIGIRMTENE